MKRVGLVVSAALLSLFVAACGDGSGPASLEFLSISPAQPRIGDIVTVKFRAVDTRGLPAEGTAVRFSTESAAPGVVLQPAEGSTNKGSGEVSTQIIASSRVTSLVVIATAGDKVAQSPPITVAGTSVSDRGITFGCGETSDPGWGGTFALIAYGPGRNLLPGVATRCTAHVSDRNGDGVPNALVSFLTEAGTIGPSAQSTTDTAGNADVVYKTTLPLPKDVDPDRFVHNPVVSETHIGQRVAPDWMLPWEWRSNPMSMGRPDPACATGCDEPRRADPIRPGKINNPRDNLVTMIAVTSGEEAFVDVNNNGQYDQGEPFVDTVEPFVDSNDNGTWDPDELYIDTNGDGMWSPKNGVYDKNTLIWAQNRILWTGLPNSYDYADPPMPNPPPGYVPTIGAVELAPGPGALDIPHLGSVSVAYKISDPWFNSFARNGDGDGCYARSTGNVTVYSSLAGTGGGVVYPTVTTIYYSIFDAHPNMEGPDAGTPLSSEYAVETFCTFTDSTGAATVYEVGMGAVSGIVD